MTFILTGTLEDHSGQPHAEIGLTIRPCPSVNPDSAADIVYSQGWSGKTDTEGRFTAELITFPGLSYLIHSTPGRVLPARRFAAPEDGALLDLADIVPIPAPSPMAEYVRGASAYEVAVANGYTGTEAEWLESLEAIVESATQPPGTDILWVGPDHDHLADPLDATGVPDGHVPTAQGDDTWAWTEQSGGSSGLPDTGLRNVTSLIDAASYEYAYATVERVGSTVSVTVDVTHKVAHSAQNVLTLPVGFRPSANVPTPAREYDEGFGRGRTVMFHGDGQIVPRTSWPDLFVVGEGFSCALLFLTRDPWPTTLPGVPA